MLGNKIMVYVGLTTMAYPLCVDEIRFEGVRISGSLPFVDRVLVCRVTIDPDRFSR